MAADFASRMSRRAAQVEDGMNKKVKAAGVAIMRELSVATPIDTGRARANWLVGLGTARTETVEGTGASMALAAAMAAISVRRSGQDLWISNNLPYIRRLNEGSSAQAPAGFVENAVQYGRDAASKVKVF